MDHNGIRMAGVYAMEDDVCQHLESLGLGKRVKPCETPTPKHKIGDTVSVHMGGGSLTGEIFQIGIRKDAVCYGVQCGESKRHRVYHVDETCVIPAEVE